MQRMRRPSWAFWTLGATVLFAAGAVFTVAIQVWVAAAVFAGLSAGALQTYMALARKHRNAGAAVVAEVAGELIEDLVATDVKRGRKTSGTLYGVPVEIFLGVGHEAGLHATVARRTGEVEHGRYFCTCCHYRCFPCEHSKVRTSVLTSVASV